MSPGSTIIRSAVTTSSTSTAARATTIQGLMRGTFAAWFMTTRTPRATSYTFTQRQYSREPQEQLTKQDGLLNDLSEAGILWAPSAGSPRRGSAMATGHICYNGRI